MGTGKAGRGESGKDRPECAAEKLGLGLEQVGGCGSRVGLRFSFDEVYSGCSEEDGLR